METNVNNIKNVKDYHFIYGIILLIFLHGFGFPGEYVNVFGTSFDTLIKYTAFLGQIGIMSVWNVSNIEDIKILNLQYKYKYIYYFVVTVTVISFIGTNYPVRQAGFCLNLAVNALFAVWLCENMSLEEILEAVYHAQMIFIVLSVGYMILFPGLYYNEMREGVFLGILKIKNVSSMQMSFGFLMQVILFKIRLKKNSVSIYFISTLILQGILLFMTNGANSILSSLIASLYVLFFTGKEKRRQDFGKINVIASTGFIVFSMTVIQWLSPVFEYFGKDATLTGRTVTWDKIIKIMQESHTMTGYGFNMFWEDPSAVELFHKGFNDTDTVWYSTMTAGAHNNLMELWLTVGLIGIAAYFIFLLAVLREPKRWNDDQYCFISGFSILLIIVGMTERVFTTYGYMTVFLFVMASVACCDRKWSNQK